MQLRLWGLVYVSTFVVDITLAGSSGSSTSSSISPVPTEEYDYIVVGSGPGGAPVAANLAKKGYSVLVLEAGEDQGDNVNEEVAALAQQAFTDPTMRWDFFVRNHADLNQTLRYTRLTWRLPDGSLWVGLDPPEGATMLGVYYPRAGTLGGCSTHNQMVAVLPSDSDFEYVTELTGDKSWSGANMRRYFERVERNHYLPNGTVGHGFNGYLDIRIPQPTAYDNQPQTKMMLEAAAKLLGENASVHELLEKDLNALDPNRDQTQGFWGNPTHEDLMARRSSAETCLSSVVKETNPDGSKKYPLTIQVHSLVTKVLVTPSRGHSHKPKAIGVEYLLGKSMYSADPRYDPNSKGVLKRVYARNEVIVSGGAFNSPQILKLSGIGPKEELTQFNITTIVDLPGVGTRLQDNYEIGIISLASQNFTTISTGPVCTFGAPGDPCLDLWRQGQGPYMDIVIVAMLFKSSHAAFNQRDIHFFPIAFPFRGFTPPTNQTNIIPPNIFDFSLVKIHSQNKAGTVKLRSADPRDTPEINFNFFAEHAEEDLAAIQDAIDWARRVYASVPVPLGPFTEVEPCPSGSVCNDKQWVVDQAWSHHATSSCAIGADDDVLAVLDSKFRVRGVDGLRIVDASAFPRTPGSFPVLPTFIIGEKASDDILNDAPKLSRRGKV